MDAQTLETLLELNRRFYSIFGAAFAATRRRVQPGVRRILQELPQLSPAGEGGRWLDLGCGSGSLGAAWAESGRQGLYLGLDFSAELLEEARQALAPVQQPGLQIIFRTADLSSGDWAEKMTQAGERFNGAMAFASLHHIPGNEQRRALLGRVRRLLVPGGLFIHSEWQFQNSPRLMARVLPWEVAGLDAANLETGDTLLDWRYALPGQEEQVGLRYVHLFTHAELQDLAAFCGFNLLQSFESDGKEGNLALYQVWQAA